MSTYYPNKPQSPLSLDVPFRFAGGYTGYVRGNDSKYWRNKVASLVATENGERVMRPFFGASLNSLIGFERQDTVESLIREAVQDCIIRWLPEVTLDDVTAQWDDKTGSVYVDIAFTTPMGESESVKIMSGSLNANGESI